MQIEVFKTTVRTVIGKNGDNAGKTFEIPEVTAYVTLPDEKFPVKITFPVPKGAPHPKPGNYEIDWSESVYVDQNNRLTLRQSPRLVPIKG